MTDNKTPRPVTRAMSQIGTDLKTWRQLRRLTIAQVADRAGVGRKTVMGLEAGHNPTLESVLRIARALGVMDQLAASVDPYESDVGRLRADEALPTRVRHPKETAS
jgi:transcriptional regulator with XRE-family HTH domain